MGQVQDRACTEGLWTTDVAPSIRAPIRAVSRQGSGSTRPNDWSNIRYEGSLSAVRLAVTAYSGQ